MALKLLVDTSVWLDLAKDYRQQPVIAALEDLVAAGEIELIVPQVLLDEFARNKERVAIDATRSLQSHFNLVRDAVNRFEGESEKAAGFVTVTGCGPERRRDRTEFHATATASCHRAAASALKMRRVDRETRCR